MKPAFDYYSNIAAGKIKNYAKTYTFSAEAWNAYGELLTLREYAKDMKKNNERKLYEKAYNQFVNGKDFGIALVVEHRILKDNIWA